jgi:hypothetical protein
VPFDPGDLWVVLLPLFLVIAGSWIFLSEHSWTNAVLVLFVFVCVLLNSYAVWKGMAYLVGIVRDKLRAPHSLEAHRR